MGFFNTFYGINSSDVLSEYYDKTYSIFFGDYNMVVVYNHFQILHRILRL
jgi:hypothetical protein